MRTIELYGTISDEGVLTITNRPRLTEWCQQNKGKNIVVKLERKYNKRSSPQNRYYHGVVVQEIRLGFLDVGYEMSADEVHYFLKQKFNAIEVPGVGGEVIEVPGSTTEMTTVQFMEYVDRIARWAAEYLNVTIPAPNTDLKMQF
jgi:hypothetical protein